MTTTTKNTFLVLALPALIITQATHSMELEIFRKETSQNFTKIYSEDKTLQNYTQAIVKRNTNCHNTTTDNNLPTTDLQLAHYYPSKNALRLLKNGSSPLMRTTNNQMIAHNAINTPQDLLLLLAKEKQNTLTITEKIELWSKLQDFIQEYNQTNAQKAIQGVPTTIQTDVPKTIKTDMPTTIKKNAPTATHVPTTIENAFSIFANGCATLLKPNFFL